MTDLSCKRLCWFGMMWLLPLMGLTQQEAISRYNPVWHSQSKNSGESMPCGGGDIGLNVWVENGELLFYFSRSGTFDENNAFLKLGRVRMKLSPNPFAGKTFRQELDLQEGSVKIHGADKDFSADIEVWVDVFRPVIHVEVNSNQPVQAEAAYESWRHEDRVMQGKENNANSYKWAAVEVTTFHDSIAFQQDQVLFYHQNRDEPSIFDVTVHQQGMDSVKSQMFNPLENLIFSGVMQGKNMQAAGTYTGKYIDTPYKGWKLRSKTASPRHQVEILLHTDQTAIADWQSTLQKLTEEAHADPQKARQKTKDWWKAYWDRSYIYLMPDQPDTASAVWQVGRNYQLFRYMLGCNAYGDYPTKFNGGLFTYDPSLVDSTLRHTPDFRNWGGGTMTAQNQRLVYFPMLKSGDFDMMPSQFSFYLRSQHNAELRSQVYWGHAGACFTEQIENFGLPNCSEYGWERPKGYDPGIQYNAWLEYQWDTVLEFCLMMLETERYTGQDISVYLPFIESCLTFFDEHYQYLARQRGVKSLDDLGKLILYPGSACETYKMTYNATSTIAALQTVLSRLMALPSRYLNEEKENIGRRCRNVFQQSVIVNARDIPPLHPHRHGQASIMWKHRNCILFFPGASTV